MNFIGSIEEEVQQLKKADFLLPEETAKDVREDLHHTKIWADVFWRRRKNHAKRVDPEISFVYSNNPRTILEIGIAYGRVQRKLAEYNKDVYTEKAKLWGIEICPYFKQFFNNYIQKHSVLRDTIFVDEDLFKTKELPKKYFDTIVLPMNTFPSFPISVQEKLFSTIKKYLKEKGIWIFTTYRPKNKSIFDPRNTINRYSEELLVEQGEELIAGEHYEFKAVRTDYGMKRIAYSRYVRLNQKYEIQENELFRNMRIFYNPEYMNELIENQGFELVFLDNSSHSTVYGITLI